MSRTAGLVLAAGEGRRFGGPKAAVVIDGERLVDRAVRCLREGGCDRVYVVLGAWVGDVPSAEVLVNPDWASGMGSSLRVGLQGLSTDRDVDDVVVTLVDLPGLTPAAVRRIVDAPGDLVVGTYDGTRGHPVRFGRDHWAAITETLSGDEGARNYLRDRSDVTLIELADVASGADLDAPTAQQ